MLPGVSASEAPTTRGHLTVYRYCRTPKFSQTPSVASLMPIDSTEGKLVQFVRWHRCMDLHSRHHGGAIEITRQIRQRGTVDAVLTEEHEYDHDTCWF